MNLPRIGEVFEDRYEVHRILGQGGFATVYHATDRAMSRAVVIKVLSPREGGYDGAVRARFLREARVFAGLHDPHTITMYDFGESRTGLLYMVFEYIDGRDLSDVIADQGRLPPVVVGHVVEQLLSALREAHAQGILHRDMKPANVLVYTYDGDPYRVKLIDFGIAKDTTGMDGRLTRTGHVVGTVRYMSPEQLLGGEVGPQSDLYSLGLVAFEMLTARPAIFGESQKEILKQQVSDVPLRIPPGVAPPGLSGAIEHLMARTPDQRPASAADALRELRATRAETAGWVQTVAPQPAPAPAPAGVTRPEPPLARFGTLAAQDLERQANERKIRRMTFLIGVAAAVLVAVILIVSAPRDEARVPARQIPSASPGLVVQNPTTGAPQAAALLAAEPAEPPTQDGTAEPRDGCGREPPFKGAGVMKTDLFGDSWDAYIPENYDPNVRYPVLLMFHRKLGRGEKLLRASKMGKAAEQRGFVVFSFSSPQPMDWPATTIAVVQEALLAGSDQLCLDRTRVYAYGNEMGSSMVRELALAVPLSAVAVTSVTTGAIGVAEERAPRLRIYGSRDLAIPPEGGQGCSLFGGSFASASAIDSEWKKAHGCSGEELPWGDYPGGTCRTWACEKAPYVVCETDTGEIWPIWMPVFEPDKCRAPKPEVEFPYRDVIWDFFEQEGRRLEPPPP